MKEFFTKEGNSTPRKMPLFLKSGEATEHYLMIIGTESDEFRLAQAKAMRSAAISASESSYGDEEAKALDLMLISSLIDSWSFDEECTDESKAEFLNNAPYLRDAVNVFGADQDNFTKK